MAIKGNYRNKNGERTAKILIPIWVNWSTMRACIACEIEEEDNAQHLNTRAAITKAVRSQLQDKGTDVLVGSWDVADTSTDTAEALLRALYPEFFDHEDQATIISGIANGD